MCFEFSLQLLMEFSLGILDEYYESVEVIDEVNMELSRPGSCGTRNYIALRAKLQETRVTHWLTPGIG